MSNDFEEGERVVLTMDYPEIYPRHKAGDKGTVMTHGFSLVTVKFDNGTRETVYPKRLKRLSEHSQSFTKGAKVRFIGDNTDWKGVTGILEEDYTAPNLCRVKLTSEPRNKSSYFQADIGKIARLYRNSLEVVTDEEEPQEPKVIKFSEIQRGDTIRRTKTYDDGSTSIRTGVVDILSTYSACTEGGNLVLGYPNDGPEIDVTLELIKREAAQPKVWEDAEVGDIFIRSHQGRDVTTVTRVKDGWAATYKSSTGVFVKTFEIEDTHIFEGYDSITKHEK